MFIGPTPMCVKLNMSLRLRTGNIWLSSCAELKLEKFRRDLVQRNTLDNGVSFVLVAPTNYKRTNNYYNLLEYWTAESKVKMLPLSLTQGCYCSAFSGHFYF